MVVIKVKSVESCPNNAGAEVFEGKSRLTASKENIADVDNKSLEAHVAASETPRPAFQELNVPHRYCKKKVISPTLKTYTGAPFDQIANLSNSKDS